MANHAYAGLWTQGFDGATMLDHFGALLATVPFSAERPGISHLIIRAVDHTESPVIEFDLRKAPLAPAQVVEMAGEHLNGDSSFEVAAHWDLWVYELERNIAVGWKQRPQRLEIICSGPDYDGGAATETGHFFVDLGFEHFFTGHAGLLGSNGKPAAAPQHAVEAAFLAVMSRAENLREYQQKTRENIRLLLDWMNGVSAALPVERTRLWSEGEANFEMRLDEVIAAR